MWNNLDDNFAKIISQKIQRLFKEKKNETGEGQMKKVKEM